MTSGGNVTPGSDVMACQFTLEELRVVVEEAHALGVPVTAHAHGLPAVEQAVAAGVDGIEHGTCVTPPGSGSRSSCWRRWPPARSWSVPRWDGCRVSRPRRPSSLAWPRPA